MSIGSELDALLAALPVGPQGPPGNNGPQGPQGPPGASGNVPMFVVSGGTEAAINAALAQAAAAGGGDVVLENQPYTITNGIVLPSGNIRLRGQARSELVANANVNLLFAQGGIAGPTAITADVALFAGQMTVADPSIFQVGKVVSIQRYNTTTTAYYSHLAEITAVAGSVISFSPMIGFALPANDPANNFIYVMTTVDNLLVEGITFTGTANPAMTAQRGIQYRRLRDVVLRDLTFNDFAGASALRLDFGLGARVSDIVASRSGSAQESDIFLTGQTFLSACGLYSRNATGFGPQFSQCSYPLGSRIYSYRANGRGVKFAGALYGNFSDVVGNESPTTGIAISLGTSYCSFANLTALNNGSTASPYNSVGVWFSGQQNRNNTISSAVVFGNPTADIALFQTDDNNVIRQARYGTLYNIGTNNTVSAT